MSALPHNIPSDYITMLLEHILANIHAFYSKKCYSVYFHIKHLILLHFLSISFCISLSLFLSVSHFITVALSPSFSLFLSSSLSLFSSLPLFLFFLCLSLCVSLSFSLCLSLSHTHTHTFFIYIFHNECFPVSQLHFLKLSLTQSIVMTVFYNRLDYLHFHTA